MLKDAFWKLLSRTEIDVTVTDRDSNNQIHRDVTDNRRCPDTDDVGQDDFDSDRLRYFITMVRKRIGRSSNTATTTAAV
jgi:hypothetical protein